ncbi:MAG: DUF2723 domain-containing protein [Endomicrobia bacterium]|nr:DUF2723 domain-containing protein [Endomicrobiia bacterium]
MFPTVAAYRDAGEMSTVGYILGISHPPGYPLYTIISYLFTKIFNNIGNIAYRINILSAVFSSISAVILFRIYRLFVDNDKDIANYKNNKILINIVGYFVILVFSFGYLQWYLSLVAEMYTLNIFFCCLMILILLLYYYGKKYLIYLFFFIFGLSFTNRMDILLLFPIGFILFINYIKFTKKDVIKYIFLLFFLGLSLYIYLPIRSSVQPVIDWNNPEQLIRLWFSITRRTHGSTLDLISSRYAPFENFFDGIKFYFSYILKNYTFFGFIILAYGAYISIKNYSYLGMSLFFSWFLSCVFFIYKANMPPNPHAMAILEAHFLQPNVIVFIWFILGIFNLIKRYFKFWYFILFFVVYLVIFNFVKNIYVLNKRSNFYAYDYATNVLRTVSDSNIIIIKEDVQIFSCWYKKFVEKQREKLNIVAAGLSGAGWYQQMYKNYLILKGIDKNSIYIGSLHSKEDWEKFILTNNDLNYGVFVTNDVEIPQLDNYLFNPYGLLINIKKKHSSNIKDLTIDYAAITDFLYKYIYVHRGKYIYDLNWDFFCSDLVEDNSKSLLNAGHWLVKNGYSGDLIEKFYKFSMKMNPVYPYNYFELGYFYFNKGFYERSYIFYKLATEKFEEYVKLAIKYKAFPEVIKSIKDNTANSYLHLGVVVEKLNNLESSIEYYNKALYYNPYLVEAYYNLAVVYWKKSDWQRVRYYLQETLRLNPYHQEAKYFIDKIPK